MSDSTINKSFLQNLWNRRFFQYLATYLGVCWGLIQFSEWIVNRYGFESQLIDHIALFLFGILPSITAFIYFHGSPGDDQWRPLEKLLYPINMIFALGASLFFIDGQAQSTTRQITVSNEEGDTILRQVPKMEFTKRVVFFPLESDLEEKDKWMEMGIPVLADLDIEQDMEWYSIRPTSLKEECEDYGYDYLASIPFSVKIKVAKNLYCDYFAEGSLSKGGVGYSMDLKIVRSRDGKEMYNNKLEASTIYGLSDQISSALYNNIDKKNIESGDTYVDLPSSDLISDNTEALEAYIKSKIHLNKGIDGIPQAYQEIQKAVQLDPNCAECFMLKGQIENNLGMNGSEATGKSVQLSENLPERQKLEMKFYNYSLSREPEKARKLLEFWKDLYPQDVLPFSRLITLNRMNFNLKNAAEIAKEARDAGHAGDILLTSADIAVKTGNLDQAQEFIDEYEQKYPEKAAKKSLLGEIYFAKGEYEKSIQIYDNNAILNPNNVDVYNKLAQSYIYDNNFNKGLNAFNEGLSRSRNFRDSIQVYQKIMDVSVVYGMVEEYLVALNQSRSLYFKNYPKAAFIQPLLVSGSIFGAIYDYDSLDKTIEEIIEITPEPSLPILQKLIKYLNALWRVDGDAFEEAWNEAKPILVNSAGETALIQGELFTNYFNKDWEKVLEVFKKFSEISGSDINNAASLLTESYSNLGRYEDGIKAIDKFLETAPKNPNLLGPKFQLLMESGKYSKAREILPTVEKSFEMTDNRWKYKVEFEEWKDKLLALNE